MKGKLDGRERESSYYNYLHQEHQSASKISSVMRRRGEIIIIIRASLRWRICRGKVALWWIVCGYESMVEMILRKINNSEGNVVERLLCGG